MGGIQEREELPGLFLKSQIINCKFDCQAKENVMSASALKKVNTEEIIIVKKMRDYSKEPAFVKKAEEAKAFLKKHGLPKAFSKKK